ncbi:hypothetical protein HDU93_007809, partial [Gonapodya sp. JEL0774]
LRPYPLSNIKWSPAQDAWQWMWPETKMVTVPAPPQVSVTRVVMGTSTAKEAGGVLDTEVDMDTGTAMDSATEQVGRNWEIGRPRVVMAGAGSEAGSGTGIRAGAAGAGDYGGDGGARNDRNGADAHARALPRARALGGMAFDGTQADVVESGVEVEVGMAEGGEKEPLPDLNPDDRHDMVVAKWLSSVLPKGHTSVLRDDQATRDAVDKELRAICQKSTSSDDILILYFSGHGAWMGDGASDEDVRKEMMEVVERVEGPSGATEEDDDEPCFCPYDFDSAGLLGIPPSLLRHHLLNSFSGRTALCFFGGTNSDQFASRMSSPTGSPINILSLSATTSEWQIPPSWTFSESILECLRGSLWCDADGKGFVTAKDMCNAVESDVLFADSHLATHHATPGFDMSLPISRTQRPGTTGTTGAPEPGASLDVIDTGSRWNVGDRLEVWIEYEPDPDENDDDEDDEEGVKESGPVGTKDDDIVGSQAPGRPPVKTEDEDGEWVKAKITVVLQDRSTTPPTTNYHLRLFHYPTNHAYPPTPYTDSVLRAAPDPLLHLGGTLPLQSPAPSTSPVRVLVKRGASRQTGVIENVKGGCVFVVYDGTEKDMGEWIAGDPDVVERAEGNPSAKPLVPENGVVVEKRKANEGAVGGSDDGEQKRQRTGD